MNEYNTCSVPMRTNTVVVIIPIIIIIIVVVSRLSSATITTGFSTRMPIV